MSGHEPPGRAPRVSRAALWLLLALCCASPSGAEAPPPKVVLLLYAAAGLPPGPTSMDADIRATLQAGVPGPLQFYTELLDLSWATGEPYEERLAALLRDKYAGQRIDLIVSVSAPALRFLLKHRSRLFPGLPVVFYGVEAAAFDERELDAGVRGIRTHPEWGATLEAALALHPGTSQVAVVSGTSDLDRALKAAAIRALARYGDRVQVAELSDEPMERLVDEAARLPKGTIVLYVSLLRDAAGRRFNGVEALSALAQASSAPIYAASEAYLGHGIVGGRLSSDAAQGAKAGALALRILRGEPAQSLPIVEEGAAGFMFDGRELRRWGISERLLPPGSVVRYEEPSLWARYRWPLVLGAGVALWATLGVGLLLQWAGRRRAETSLAERVRFESLLADLSAGLVHVTVVELDAAIGRALLQIGEFLGVDRAALHEHLPARAAARIAWVRAGIEGLPPSLERERLPWTIEQTDRGEDVRFSTLDELPAAAAVDRRTYEAAGTRSALVLSLKNGGAVLGVLLFDVVRSHRVWPSRVVLERIRLLSEVFAAVLERKRVELSLDEQLRFEALLAEQSAAFSRVSDDRDVDRAIERALGDTVRFLEVDRASLVALAEDGETGHVTHRWATAGTAPAPETLALAELPWVATRLRAGEVVCFSRSEELPEETAATDRRTYARLGITSDIKVPLMSRDALVGVLVFSTLGTARAWRTELIQRLRLLGEVFANILSRRRSDRETDRLRQDLAHVARVSTVGELTASLAHELSQPLAAILANAQAAQRMLDVDATALGEIREILHDIVEDDKRASLVIARLRGLLKRAPLETSSLDLNEITREVALLVRGDAVARGVPIRLDLASGLPPLRGDRVQLQQVLMNLVLNGLDAVRDRPASARLLVLQTARDGAAAVRVTVRDTGGGIAPEALAQVFEAFYTTKPEGLGMGLAIVRSIVEAHGGRVRAENHPEGGAAFTVSLPAGAERP